MIEGGPAHNALSGTVRSAVQARIVHGGVHLHDVPPAGHFWATVVLALLAIALSTLSLVLAVRRAAVPVAVGMPPLEPEITRSSGLAELEVPYALNTAEQAYILEIPERAEVRSFQGYRCAGRIYHRAVVGVLQIPKVSSNIALVARDYADKFVTATWDPEGLTQFEPPVRITRSNYGGSRSYLGMEVVGSLKFAVNDTCGSDAVVIDALALDRGDNYFVVVAAIGVDADTGYDNVCAVRDAHAILTSIIPAE